jgi:hypothetical protein
MDLVNKLVVFGDSWPYGWDLKPGELPFGKLIAEDIGCKYELYAQPNTAIDNMILQLNRFLSTGADTNCTALFCLTDPSRSLYFNPNPAITSVMWDGFKPGDTVSEAYYKNIHSETLEYFRLAQSVIVLQSICRQYNIRDLYVSNFTNINWNNSLCGIDLSKFYNNGKGSFLDFFGCKYVDHTNKYFEGSATAHPNQLGHQLIAENLIPWVKSAHFTN